MKKHLLAFILALLPAAFASAAAAQDYYTLPEIREQAAQGWHETYTDKFGRTIPVDVAVEVFGKDAAPVLKVRPAHYPLNAALFEEGTVYKDDGGITIYRNNPADFVFQAKSGEQPLIVHRSYGEKVDMNELYRPEYGTVCTVQQMVDRLRAVLAPQGIPTEDYVYDQPKDFSVRCKINKKTGEVVEPAIYLAHFWQKLHGLPVLAHASDAFVNTDWPAFSPQIVFGMRHEDEFQIAVQAVEETQVLAQDIPLCSFEQVRRSVETLIENGYVRRVFDARLGFAVFNDPGIAKDAKSAFDVDYYLVPAWVVNCIYMDSAKKDWTYGGKQTDELMPDEKNVPEYDSLIINAQTGEPLDRNDKSEDGHGNADYRGFIPWETVR